MKKILFPLLVSLAFGLAAAPARAEEPAPPPADDKALHERADGLRKEWDDQKGAYKKKFNELLDSINKRIEDLQKEKDYGDDGKRKSIADAMNSLLRDRNELKRYLDELKAASAINWVHLKTRLDDFFARLTGRGDSLPR
ncbi:MAG TPA: hypothetical protein VL404_05855 [Candidatus Eisenbacteria bacterium]|jgi:hypothetical protein|nr:hypothetical protein [Candidatus Eisenbacteria bacterium]